MPLCTTHALYQLETLNLPVKLTRQACTCNRRTCHRCEALDHRQQAVGVGQSIESDVFDEEQSRQRNEDRYISHHTTSRGHSSMSHNVITSALPLYRLANIANTIVSLAYLGFQKGGHSSPLPFLSSLPPLLPSP